MRKLKFRAWDRGNKEMLFDNELLVTKLESNKFDPTPLNQTLTILSAVHELMQFTGLHDKNGKEIYEGDIVKRINTEGSIEITEVKYKAPYWTVKDFAPEYGYTVIGNIYENPELLT